MGPCAECDRPATRTGGQGEPLCRDHWVAAGMYDPLQGLEPTERDWQEFAARGAS